MSFNVTKKIRYLIFLPLSFCFLVGLSVFFVSQTIYAQSSYCKARANSIAPKINFFSLGGNILQLKSGGCLVNFSFQAYDIDDCYLSNKCLTAELDFGDGQKYIRNLGCERWTIPHIYKNEGTFTAKLQICDPSKKCAQKEISNLKFGKIQPRTTEPAGPSGTSDPFSTVSGELLDKTTVLCDPTPKTTPAPPTTPPSTPPSTPPTTPPTPPSTPQTGTFDILFVPLNYQDTSQDKSAFQTESDSFKKKILNMAPFSEFKDKINFSFMEPKDCQLKCQDPKMTGPISERLYNPCLAKLISCTKNIDKNKIDKILGIIKYNTINTEVIDPQTGKKNAFFAQANGIPGQYAVIYPIENYIEKYSRRNTGLHEIGHLFGLYHILVEKIIDGKDICSSQLLKQSGPKGYCVGPNASDCNDPKKDTDILSYCLVRDHYGPAGLAHIKKELKEKLK